MIEICRLKKRLVNPEDNKLPNQLEQIKVFSMSVGHGIGTVDFVECIDKIEEDEYFNLLKTCGEYANFKLGNLSKYFEIEVFPEHASQLVAQMPNCQLKKHFLDLKEGFIVIRKSI